MPGTLGTGENNKGCGMRLLGEGEMKGDTAREGAPSPRGSQHSGSSLSYSLQERNKKKVREEK